MVNLVKGQKVELTKGNPGPTKINAGLGWDVNAFDSGSQFDLDTEVFLLGDNGKVTSDGDFVFYGNTVHASGSVEHTGDNRDGVGDGDDETIKIDLSKVPQNISRITFAVTIYDAAVRNQNFGQVNNAFIRIYNPDTNEELLRYDLTEDFSIETALVIGELSSRSNHHLEKIENGWLADKYREKLQEISVALGTSIPATLNLEQQSYFALGYYQMGAKLNQERNRNVAAAREKTGAAEE